MAVTWLGGRTRWLIRGRTGVAAIVQTIVAQFVMLGASIGTGIITARALGPAGRGMLAAVTLVPAVVSALVTFGLPAAMLYHLKRNADQRREIVGAGLILALLFGVVALGIAQVVIPFAFHQYDSSVIGLARIIAFVLPLTVVSFVVSSIFESAGDFWYANRLRALSPIMTLVLLVVFVVMHRLTVLTAALSYALPIVPVVLASAWEIIRRYRPSFNAGSSTYKRLMSYGARSYGSDILKLIGTQADQILVVTFLSPPEMGLYSIALSLAWTLQIVQNSVSRVLMPRIAARAVDEVVASVGRAARVASVITAAGCIALITAGPILLRLFYGERFDDAVPVVRILAVEAFFSGTASVLIQAFLALGRPGTVTILQTIGVGLSVPLMLLLIPRVGLPGAALALLIATVIRFFFVVGSFRWVLHTRAPRLFLTRADVRYLRGRLRIRHAPQS